MTAFNRSFTWAVVLLLSLPAGCGKAALDLFGATRFVATEDVNYNQIEAVGRQIGMIVNNGAR
jgi:hypothetical protein